MKDNDLDLPDDDFVKEEALMTSFIPGPRIIVLAGKRDDTLLGFVLSESDDSILVGHPSQLSSVAEESKKIIPFIPVPYVRIMKSNILAISFMFGEFEDYFLNYLRTEANTLYPVLEEDIDLYLASTAEDSPFESFLEPRSPGSMSSKEEAFEEALAKAKESGVVVSIKPSKH